MSGRRLADAVAQLGRPAGHYSHAACAGNLVFLSGQLPITPQGRRLNGVAFGAQAAQVFDNVDRVLDVLGCPASI
jgi:2-iminobutanoate/2-iminopropanoate deaminase